MRVVVVAVGLTARRRWDSDGAITGSRTVDRATALPYICLAIIGRRSSVG